MASSALQISESVGTAPERASADLTELFAELGTVAAVAERLGIGRRTLTRWLSRLTAAGVPVRVRVRRGWPLGRKRGARNQRNSRGKQGPRKK